MRTVSTVTVVGFSIKNQTYSISEDESAEEADLKIRPETAQMVGYLHISHCFIRVHFISFFPPQIYFRNLYRYWVYC